MLNKIGRNTRNALAALLAVAATGYVAYALSWKSGLENLLEDANSRLKIATAMLLAPTDKYSYLPQVVAEHPVITNLIQDNSAPERVHQANLFLERLNSRVKSTAIYILDPSGVVITSSNWNDPRSFVSRNYAFRPYFQDALKHGSGHFYGIGTTSKMPGYYISQAIRGKDEVLGVVVVKVDMSGLDRRWTTDGHEAMVADANGVIFLSSQPDMKYRPLRPLSEQASNKLKASRQYEEVLKEALPMNVLRELGPGAQLVRMTDTGYRTRHKETDYLLRTSTLNGSNWTIGVMMPLAGTYERALGMAVLMTCATALIILSGTYLAQLRWRTHEREHSRMRLELAHRALRRKHRELQSVSEELRISAITDPVTGAYNQSYFFEMLPKILSMANRHHLPLSFLRIEGELLRRIGAINGTEVADKVLRKVSTSCRASLREEDMLARYEGSGFIAALPNTSAEEARCVVERLCRKALDCDIELPDQPQEIVLRCGISQYREGEPDAELALKRADDALEQARGEDGPNVAIR